MSNETNTSRKAKNPRNIKGKVGFAFKNGSERLSQAENIRAIWKGNQNRKPSNKSANQIWKDITPIQPIRRRSNMKPQPLYHGLHCKSLESWVMAVANSGSPPRSDTSSSETEIGCIPSAAFCTMGYHPSAIRSASFLFTVCNS